MKFSVIVPVYNRPDEIREFFESLVPARGEADLEVIIVEDGSTLPCESVVALFRDELPIRYFIKPNSGPGDSRNFGMQQATGDYFLIFDSDCLLPADYFAQVESELHREYVDAFGGPDAAHPSFTDVQKAINFAMTSWITTGGVRGGDAGRFQPRSFNMGLSRAVFEATGGFGNIHPGEDPDLVLRMWDLGFKTRLFPKAFVYHKRRIDWAKFRLQVKKFGKARPILNAWHPKYTRLSFFLPSVFIVGLFGAVGLMLISVFWPAMVYLGYFVMVFVLATAQNKNLRIGALSVMAVFTQFYGYGTGFLQSWMLVQVMNRKPQEVFPELFFRI